MQRTELGGRFSPTAKVTPRLVVLDLSNVDLWRVRRPASTWNAIGLATDLAPANSDSKALPFV